MDYETFQPNALATAQGNLTRLEMLILDFTTKTLFPTTHMQRCLVKDFLSNLNMNQSGNSYTRVQQAFEHLKQPILNLSEGKVPLFDSQSTCENGVMNFKLSREILNLY